MSTDANVTGEHAVRSTVREQDVHADLLQLLAHDLRGPAGVTLGALDELELALGPQAERVASLLGMARRGVRRVLAAADRIDRTGQLGAHTVDWVKEPVDVRELVERATREAEQIESRHRIQVVLTSQQGPCRAMVDVAWLSCAVGALVSDAICGAKKLVSIETRGEGQLIQISITDDRSNGIALQGRSLDTLAARRDLALSRSLSRGVAKAHGGDLVVDSLPTGTLPSDDHASAGARVVLTLLSISDG